MCENTTSNRQEGRNQTARLLTNRSGSITQSSAKQASQQARRLASYLKTKVDQMGFHQAMGLQSHRRTPSRSTDFQQREGRPSNMKTTIRQGGLPSRRRASIRSDDAPSKTKPLNSQATFHQTRGPKSDMGIPFKREGFFHTGRKNTLNGQEGFHLL